MATWYREGTVSVTNNSKTVTGSGSLWSSMVTGTVPMIKQGDVFTVDGDKWYEIDTIDSHTQITLKTVYLGSTASGSSYAIIRNFTNTTNADLANSLSAVLTKWHNREVDLINWLTGSGTITLTKTDSTTVSVKTPTQIQNEWIGKASKTLSNADVTLTTAEAGNAFLVLSGTLTANVNVIVPTAQSHVWFVLNNTTGSYSVTIKTSTGTGVVVDQGQRAAVFCDGTNVLSCSTNIVGSSATSTPTNAMLGSAAYADVASLVPNVFVGSSVTSAYTVSVNDWGRVIPVSGTVTVTIPDGATMAPGFNVTISNGGTGVVTLARSSTNTIDGQTSFLIGRGMNTSLFWTGTEWRTIKSAQFGFRDLTAELTVKGTTGSDPSFEAFRGGLYAYSFSPTVTQSVFMTFHVQHDYAPGTPIYFHTHWASNTPTTGGAVRWGFEYSIAKGHGQSDGYGEFVVQSPVYVSTTVTAQYRHMVSETTAITNSAIEPDSLILVRMFRDATAPEDTYTDKVFGFTADIHYQTDRYSTPNKSPTFYA